MVVLSEEFMFQPFLRFYGQDAALRRCCASRLLVSTLLEILHSDIDHIDVIDENLKFQPFLRFYRGVLPNI